MAIPERDPLYSTDGTTRSSSSSVYTRDSNATGWFVGIIVALALIAIGYLVFSANSGPSTTTVPASTTTDTTINNTPAVTPPADTSTTPMTSTTPDTSITPAAPAPDTSVTPAAPADTAPAPADTMAPATPAAPAAPAAPAQ